MNEYPKNLCHHIEPTNDQTLLIEHLSQMVAYDYLQPWPEYKRHGSFLNHSRAGTQKNRSNMLEPQLPQVEYKIQTLVLIFRIL
jgi:hypothetical protein